MRTYPSTTHAPASGGIAIAATKRRVKKQIAVSIQNDQELTQLFCFIIIQ